MDSLKKELERQNALLRGHIQVVRVIFTKPLTTEGQVKVFLKARAARDDIVGRTTGTVYKINNYFVSLCSASTSRHISLFRWILVLFLI